MAQLVAATNRTMRETPDRVPGTIALCPTIDGDFLPEIRRLLGPDRRVGLIGFREFVNAGFAELAATGRAVLDASTARCRWQTATGLVPAAQLPSLTRTDFVQNSNDSFFHTNPAQRFGEISPMVGDARVERPRTRAGLAAIPALLAPYHLEDLRLRAYRSTVLPANWKSVRRPVFMS